MSELMAQAGSFAGTMGGDVLFVLGAMLLVGYMSGLLAGRIRLPEITGFVLAGVLIGESGLGLVPRQLSVGMRWITEIALGLIALTIGSEFAWGKLRRLGRTVLLATLLQLAVTFLLVLPVMRLAGLELPFALIIAAIATASSPAVIVAMVQSLHVRGTFVDCVYGVVALLDAGAVVLFGITFSIAAGMMGLAGDGSAFSLAVGAAGEVAASIVFGMAVGLLLHLVVRRKERTSEIVLIVLGVLLITTALANALHVSVLLVMTTVGMVMINLTPRNHRVFRALEPVTPPIFALFFVLAGCELELGLLRLPAVVVLGGAYLVARTLGKVLGAYAGARLAGAPAPMRRNLGWCMLPQAGVSLGLVLMVQSSPLSARMTPAQADTAVLLVNVVLLAVFVYQLVGPPVARMALLRGSDMEIES